MEDANVTRNGAARDAGEHSGISSSLRDLLGVVFRRGELIRRCFIGLLGGALLAVLFLPRTYEAEMKIFVDRERVDPVVSTESSVLEQDRDLTEDEVVSEVELFQSRDSLEKAVVDCGLYQPTPHSLAAFKLRVLGALGVAPSEGKRIYEAVLRLEKNLQVIPVNSSNLIKATYDSSSPQMSARVLRELGDLYLAKHAAVHRPGGTSAFFDQQAQQYQKQLADAEAKLVRFNRTSGSVAAEYEKQVTLQKISDFNVSLEQTRAEVAGTKQRLAALKTQEKLLTPRITTQVKVSDNYQLMANLKTTLLNLELKRTELLEKYDPNYPPVKEVEQEISEAIASIRDAEEKGFQEKTTDFDPTYQWIRTETAKDTADLVGLEARETAMSTALRMMTSRALQLDRDSEVQQDLLRTAKADEESYLLYHRKREEARIADALDQRRIINAAIAEQPVAPMIPAGLPWGIQLILSIVFAGLVSLGLGFAAEYVDPSFRTPKEVREYLEVPLLASIPKNGH
jgi:uncharacterized protein involved in exopolysaccharide biosynthesis